MQVHIHNIVHFLFQKLFENLIYHILRYGSFRLKK